MADFHFGVEIEMCAEPHTLRLPIATKYALYYEKLAAALRNRALSAKANDLSGGRRSADYSRWWITNDSSLSGPANSVPMEAVSPILSTGSAEWPREIETFWRGFAAVFHMPDRNQLCGSHVHVSKGPERRFSLPELKTIAYGVVLYEPLLLDLLMDCRRNNRYCQPNSQASGRLRACGGRRAVATLIASADGPALLHRIMQDHRYVLWNFANIEFDRPGTIEFRGGRFLRGAVRTKRWIALAVSFIAAVLAMDDLANPDDFQLEAWTPAALYKAIKNAASGLGMQGHLPSNYKVLNETQPS